MIHRSLSAASLLKQATVAVNVQKTRDTLRPHISRSSTDYPSEPFSQGLLSGESSSASISTESSGIKSPNCGRKHTRFNERVEQYIAVESKGVDHDSDEIDTGRYSDDSDADYGVMMKRRKTRKPLLVQQKASESKLAKGETIAMLPPTTLNYREDAPERRGTASKHSRNPIMPTSSQDIVRPTKQPRTGPSSPAEDANGGLPRSRSSDSLCEAPTSMRRNPSDIFMPYEEGGVSSTDGILDRVIDTVNTARDIAHIIWSVGWKK
jgi:hypothetical protein